MAKWAKYSISEREKSTRITRKSCVKWPCNSLVWINANHWKLNFFQERSRAFTVKFRAVYQNAPEDFRTHFLEYSMKSIRLMFVFNWTGPVSTAYTSRASCNCKMECSWLDLHERRYSVGHALFRFDAVRYFVKGLCDIWGFWISSKEPGYFKESNSHRSSPYTL